MEIFNWMVNTSMETSQWPSVRTLGESEEISEITFGVLSAVLEHKHFFFHHTYVMLNGKYNQTVQ